MASQLLTDLLIMSTTKSDLVSLDQLDSVRGGFSKACIYGALGLGTAGGLGGAAAGGMLGTMSKNVSAKGLGVTGLVGGLVAGCAAGALVNAAKS